MFAYTAKKPSGDVVSASIKAGDVDQVKQFLASKGLIVLDVARVAEEGESFLDSLPLVGSRVSTKELLIFTKYFCILVKAGIPVLKSLKILEDQTPNLKFRRMLHKIYEEVTGGSSLHNAFESFPKVFPENYCNLIRIGEESGALHEVLIRLHGNLSKAMKLKGKVVGAMTYPIVITLVAVAVVSFLLIMIIPKFVKIFAQHNARLPLVTEIVVGASNLLVQKWYLVLGVVVAVFAAFNMVLNTKSGRFVVHRLILMPPVVGPLFVKYAVADFASNLDMLSRGGASVPNALRMSIKSVSNEAMRTLLEPVVKNVEAGMGIADALKKADVMPQLVLQMIAVGEETGNLNEMLETICEFYEEEIDASVATVLSLIEPCFIIVLGGIVGTIVISMYLPIFKMSQTVSGHK
jgi:type IV pilus assembly protein PilC